MKRARKPRTCTKKPPANPRPPSSAPWRGNGRAPSGMRQRWRSRPRRLKSKIRRFVSNGKRCNSARRPRRGIWRSSKRIIKGSRSWAPSSRASRHNSPPPRVSRVSAPWKRRRGRRWNKTPSTRPGRASTPPIRPKGRPARSQRARSNPMPPTSIGVLQRMLNDLYASVQAGAALLHPLLLGYVALFGTFALCWVAFSIARGGRSLEQAIALVIRLGLVFLLLNRWPWFLGGLRDVALQLGLAATGNTLQLAEFLDPGMLVKAGIDSGAVLWAALQNNLSWRTPL